MVRRWRSRIIVTLIVCLFVNMFGAVPMAQAEQQPEAKKIDLLDKVLGITELHRDFEQGMSYLKVINMDAETIDLADYVWSTWEEDVEEPHDLNIPSTELSAGETAVIWLNQLELDDELFDLHAEDEQVINASTQQSFDGITLKNGEEEISLTLPEEDAKSHYYISSTEPYTGADKEQEQETITEEEPVEEPEEQSTEEEAKNEEQVEEDTNQEDTIEEEQLAEEANTEETEEKVEENASEESEQTSETIEIIHEQVLKGSGQDNLHIEVTLKGADPDNAAGEVVYTTGEAMREQQIELTHVEGEQWEAVIPKEELWSPVLTYKIVVQADETSITYPEEGIVQAQLEQQEADASLYPELLVTELVPDSANISGADAYEFIEIYNNTNQSVSTNDFQLLYEYPNGNQANWNLTEPKEIPSQETMVVWIHNGANRHLTIDDFNAHYGSTLTNDQLAIAQADGMANSSERSIVLAHQDGEVISKATYYDEQGFDDTLPDLGIVYKAASESSSMQKVGLNNGANPGLIQAGQVPTQPVQKEEDTSAPVIEHDPIQGTIESETVTFKANITDDQRVVSANLLYQSNGDEDFSVAPLVPVEGEENLYQVELPSYLLSGDVSYQIEAYDGINTTVTDLFTFTVIQIEVDPQSVPPILVTEVMPDTVNVNGADGYEFIEVYNNSTEPVSFNDYFIYYEYPAKNFLDWHPEGEVVIEPGEAVVFWIINHGNPHLTEADFNSQFGSDLVEGESLFRVHSDGMANGSERGLGVATKTGEIISMAYYNNAGDQDVAPDKSVLYRYPVDGTHVMDKVSSRVEAGTPGVVEDWQVLQTLVEIPNDTSAPVIQNETTITEVKETDSVTLQASINDDQSLKRTELFYAFDDNQDFAKINLLSDTEEFSHTIAKPNLVGKNQLTYYFVASDGKNETVSEQVTINITNDRSNELRLNVQDEDILNGESILKATQNNQPKEDLELSINDRILTETANVLEHDAYFAFDVKNTNVFFKNGVVMGDEILEIFDDGYSEFVTLTVPIDAERLQKGDNQISIYSGSKASPLDIESPENRNDFDVKNVRLVLADGTILRDEEFSDPNELIDIGDDGTYRPFQDFHFEISDEHLVSTGYLWDTKLEEDGPHTVKVVDTENGEEVQANVQVDNTAPTIKTSLEEGKEYKGEFTIDVTAEDTIAGVERVEARLDGEPISIPHETSSAKLSPGEHELLVEAIDEVGNLTEETITFSVVDEHPDRPDSKGEGAHLRVQVSDPTEDEMNVNFKRGYTYTLADENVNAFQHAADTEPPNVLAPEGETPFTSEQRLNGSAIDGSYITTDSTTQFPYHRFEVEVDENISEDSRVELVWNGNSLPGRKVTMYAWNHESSEWDKVDEFIAQDEDFELKGQVEVTPYVKDSKVNVIVQDEIADVPNHDYTFAWMSDTQYYSESYPHIFESQVNWLVDQRENLNLKYVFHTGDIVDEHDQEYQWENADKYMRVLDDAGIPNGVLSGNHDVGNKDWDYSKYSQYFGAHRYEDQPHYGGSFKDNRGHYDLISVNGNDFIMLYLGWGIEEDGIAWMNEVLADHPNHMAILNFHEYLLATGTRHPEGDRLFEEVVKPNPNVVAVLSGHYHSARMIEDDIDDDGDGVPDRTVYQMLADYQGGPEGGQGFLRLLHFEPSTNQIHVRTYSPYLDQYNYYDPITFPGRDEFSIELDLTPKEKRVATDFFKVNVYSEEVIGEVEGVSSGDIAETLWEGLTEGETYGWYVDVEDQYGGKATSDIWTFVYQRDGQIEEPDDGDDNDTDPPTSPDPGEQPGTQPGDGNEPPPGSGSPGDNPEPPSPSDPPGTTPGVTDPPKPVDGPNVDKGDNGSKQPSTPKDEVPASVGDKKSDDNHKGGGILPTTATTMFVWLVAGIGLLILGIVIVGIRRRKQLVNT